MLLCPFSPIFLANSWTHIFLSWVLVGCESQRNLIISPQLQREVWVWTSGGDLSAIWETSMSAEFPERWRGASSQHTGAIISCFTFLPKTGGKIAKSTCSYLLIEGNKYERSEGPQRLCFCPRATSPVQNELPLRVRAWSNMKCVCGLQAWFLEQGLLKPLDFLEW